MRDVNPIACQDLLSQEIVFKMPPSKLINKWIQQGSKKVKDLRVIIRSNKFQSI